MVDSIFGIGPMELVVILVIAGIVMGPQRIAQVARWLGKFTAQMQAISRGFALQLRNELDSIDDGGELKEALKEVRNLQQEVSQLRREVTGTATGALKETSDVINETKAAFKETEEIVQNSIHPPQFEMPEVDEAEEEPEKVSANGQHPPAPPKLPKALDIPDDPE
ncbi:MAG: twin-arginine translocase TatA/TatE family subunit [Anaerolineales bacterium]|nr:twin-arginine translocase TatA/TatE family subunit [Anaerolineales bacterium]